MPWTGNPHTDAADAVRSMVGDTNASSPKLADNAYTMIIAQERRPYARAAMAAAMLAGKYADQMTKRVGDLWREAKVQYQHYRDLAQWYRTENQRRMPAHPFVGGVNVADTETRETDTSIKQPEFTVGIMDSVDVAHSNDTEN